MSIQQKLNYPLWKIPGFIFKCFIILIRLGKSGAFSLIIKNGSFNKKTIFLLSSINFLLYRKKNEKIGSMLLKSLVSLGPGFIKLGQALSTRPDLIGVETCEDLKKLQDDIEPFPGEVAKEIIKTETKDIFDNIFCWWELS